MWPAGLRFLLSPQQILWEYNVKPTLSIRGYVTDRDIENYLKAQMRCPSCGGEVGNTSVLEESVFKEDGVSWDKSSSESQSLLSLLWILSTCGLDKHFSRWLTVVLWLFLGLQQNPGADGALPGSSSCAGMSASGGQRVPAALFGKALC